VLQKQKVNVHHLLFIYPHRVFVCVCVCVECSVSLSFFRCSPRLQATTTRNRQLGTDRSNHKRALPGASTVAVEDGRAQKNRKKKKKTRPELPISLLSGQSPTCYVTVDEYPGSGQRCQAGMMPRGTGFCVPKSLLCFNEIKMLHFLPHVAC